MKQRSLFGREDAASHLKVLFLVLLVASVGALLLIIALNPSHSPATPIAKSPSEKPDAPSPQPAALSSGADPASISAPTNASQITNVDQVSLPDLIRILKDESAPLEQRRVAIQKLVQVATPEAILAFRDVLSSGSIDIRLAVASGLAECSTPECAGILISLLNDSDEDLVKTAIQSLARQGSPAALTALAQVLYDTSRSFTIREAAATGLSALKVPGAMDTLTQAATTITDEEIANHLLKTLAGHDLSESQAFFQNFLRNPSVPCDLRVDAVEALAEAPGDASPFLTTLAQDSDSEVRAAAAWAMSAAETPGASATTIMGLVQSEQDPDVRLRLYQALANQENVDPGSVLNQVKAENDPSARIAAEDLLAKLVRVQPSPDLESYFNGSVVPSLQSSALDPQAPSDNRLASVIALSRSGSTVAMDALQNIAANATDPAVVEMARKSIEMGRLTLSTVSTSK